MTGSDPETRLQEHRDRHGPEQPPFLCERGPFVEEVEDEISIAGGECGSHEVHRVFGVVFPHLEQGPVVPAEAWGRPGSVG